MLSLSDFQGHFVYWKPVKMQFIMYSCVHVVCLGQLSFLSRLIRVSLSSVKEQSNNDQSSETKEASTVTTESVSK